MHEAMLWEAMGERKVHCFLCGHHCKISDGRKGICRVRENRGGKLYTLVYDKIIARHVDPIEKKPLFHFLPGSSSYSIATPGCNFRCMFCQNADIAQMPGDRKVILGDAVTPEEIVADAARHGCASISYTYTEPTIYFELAYDTARLAHGRGIKNVFVTNGFITREALGTIRPYLDAANIDLKGFSRDFYKKICSADLDLVLDSIRAYHEMGIWIELTTLVIPNHNDSPDELRGIARFIASLGRDIPWHVTRYHPTYKLMDQPRTPVATLKMARDIGFEEGLRYVYEGNVPGEGGEDTGCPGCGRVLVKRFGNYTVENRVKGGACADCGTKVAGVW
ncbi:MAG TPA: AmmeMemoRadiSam system radical SAM enzyme [Nitrospirota bacterium]|nr:AmmeMemoRadiSam system radical SAM enzyme [Nitrospirota bacterium]